MIIESSYESPQLPVPPTSPRGNNMAHYASSSAVLSTKKFNRPKSVPPNFVGRAFHPNEGISSVHVKIRPKTAVGSLHGICERVQQVEMDSNPKRPSELVHSDQRSTPAWQKLLQKHDPVETISSPGYTLTRSRERVKMQISYDNFFLPTPTEEKPREMDEKDLLIADLQQQLDDMTLFLEEERLNHKDTRKKAANLLEDKMKEKDNIRLNDIRILQEDHQAEIELLHQMYKKLMADEKTRTDAAYEKSRGEVEFLQAAFESYKTQLHIEQGVRWRQQEEETCKKLTEELEKRTQDMKADLELLQKKHHAEQERLHLMEIQKIRKDHKKEVDSIVKKFANAATELERLHATENRLKECEEELSILRPECERLNQELNKMHNNFEEKNNELLAYQQSFEQRAQKIADQFRQEIEDLRLENNELRTIYRRKCVEIVEQRDNFDQAQVAKIETAKDAMKFLIETRARNNVSMVAGQTSLDQHRRVPKERPSSAPGTSSEMTHTYLQAGETFAYVHRAQTAHQRPKSSRPRVGMVTRDNNNDDDVGV